MLLTRSGQRRRTPGHPGGRALAAAETWGADPLGYLAMLRFDHGRLGLPRELPGTAAIAHALIQAGAPVDGYPGDRETPLITAASYGDADIARVLIKAGADIEAVSAPDSGGVPGSTALRHAVVFGMTDVVDVLVAAGARIASLGDAAAAGDLTGWSLDRIAREELAGSLVFAAAHQRPTVIDQLVTAGAPVNESTGWGTMPLHVAARNGRPASVRRLLAHGADPDLRDPAHHRTPLEWCQPAHRYLDSPTHDEVDAILRPLTGGVTPPRAGNDPVRLQIRIEASRLPGRDWSCQRNIHVGIQRKNRRGELLGLTPGDAPSAVWTFDATAVPAPAGTDINGPYVQRRPGGRFIYLSWGSVDGAGEFTMFRRAKLWLDAIAPATLAAALRHGHLIARLDLTDTRGGPLCAAVRPPLVHWSAGRTG